MFYDDKLSEKIPMYRVLDYMIDEYEPNDIINFLAMYSMEDVKEMVRHSMNYTKMFCISFVRNLNIDNLAKFVQIMRNDDDNEKCVFLCWQVFVSDMSEQKKNMFRSFFNMHQGGWMHPYIRGNDNFARKIDSEIWNMTDPEIGEYLNTLDGITFIRLVRYRKILLKYRVFQVEVFRNLDAPHMYMLVDTLKKDVSKNFFLIYGSDISHFVRQVIFSDIDEDIRKEFICILKNICEPEQRYKAEEHNLLAMDDYSSLLIMMDIMGEVDRREILLYYLVNHPEIIKDIGENNPEYLEEHFPIGNLWKIL